MPLPRSRPTSHRSTRRSAVVLGAAALMAVGLLTTPAGAAPTPRATTAAPGAPGTLSRFDLARKDCVGTARNDTSKVWFTIADGALSDVYEPTIDNTNVHDLQYVVTDGSSFTDLQQRDTTYTVKADATGMSCTVTSTSAAHHYSLVTTYIADPARDTVLMHTTITSSKPLHVYARLDAHVNGNGGGGTQNGGGDTGTVTSGVPVIGDTGTVSAAANRDYAVPTFMSLDSTSRHGAGVGYAGSASDGLQQLDENHSLGTTYASAPNGHIVATEDVTPAKGKAIDLALGFGRTAAGATKTAASSLKASFASTDAAYLRGWKAYDKTLKRPAGSAALQKAYWVDANVLRASVDKTFPGALVASLASPWGQAVSAGDLVSGKPVYFGSYREVFARDLYEGVTGFLADGDVAQAQAATKFLFDRQQEADGRMPRNSLLNGKVAPDTGGDQLDETSYPILMAYLSKLPISKSYYEKHIAQAANFLVSHGPSFGNERWEEQSGYSPSTIAAEIAGLTAAAVIAKQQGDNNGAQVYQATADDFQRNIKDWTVTSTGTYAPRYFIRLSKTGDPNAAISYGLGNGSVTADQRDIVDGGFQDLVRLGELPANDADVQASLKVLDKTIAVSTPSGTGYYRYGTDGAGSEDGYGDCWVPDPTNCPANGEPWPTTDNGSGHLWPVLSGERAETAIASGDTATAKAQLDFMLKSASGEGLVPEQAWEDPDLAASPYGTDPTTASIGFVDGKAAGSASPLTWAQAQQLRLITDLGSNKIVDRPSITTARYVTHGAPANVPITITSPTSGATANGTVTVTGTTTPGAKVVVSSTATDSGGSTSMAAVTAWRGTYSVQVPVGFGADVITATSYTPFGTGYAQINVVGDLSGGTSVLDVTDPSNDDNGPGTYQYPTASDFHPGAFDITRFQVLTKDGTVYLRTTLRDLTPTFGSPNGAQLLDVFVHQPGSKSSSTAAPYASRNYTIAPADAWSQRFEVQGFAAPTWDDADGNQVGSAAVVASPSTKTITIAVPQSTFGTPTSGWAFTLALTGQDGYSSDQARGFQATPQGYQFGVCAAGNTAPICSVDPALVPKVIDTITPSGIDQATELNPLNGPVVLHGVPVQ